jgi:hypothetical protein
MKKNEDHFRPAERLVPSSNNSWWPRGRIRRAGPPSCWPTEVSTLATARLPVLLPDHVADDGDFLDHGVMDAVDL